MLNSLRPGSPDAVFHALAAPTRRAMVERLSQGAATVTQLANPLGMTLAGASQHLRVLEDSGLVRSEKSGRVRTCHLQPQALEAAERWLAARRRSWERRPDRHGRHPAGGDVPGGGPAGS